MFKEQLHKSFDAISPSPELLDRISAMMSEEAAHPKPSIKMTAVKYGGIAAALALAAGGTFLVLRNANGGIATTDMLTGAVPTETFAAAADDLDGAGETVNEAYRMETAAGEAAANEENAYTYGTAADNEAFIAEIAEDTDTPEISFKNDSLKTNETAAASETITMAAATTTAPATTVPPAGDIGAGAAENEDADDFEEAYDEAPMSDKAAEEPSYVNAADAADALPDTDAAGGSAMLDDKKLVVDGELCRIVSLTPLNSIVWDGSRYISLHGGNEPEFAHLISEENLVGAVTRVDGEPRNELETDFFLDAELYRGDGLMFLTAKPTELLLRDELTDPALPEINGTDGFTTENVLLIYAVFRDSDYPDHNFIGSPEFNRYISR